MPPRAFISGCAGLSLSAAEARFFQTADPWGFILFKRNCETPDQIRALTDMLRSAVGRNAPILIDQEGGRVQRMGPPHWPAYPPARAFGELYGLDRARGLRAAWLGARLMACDLSVVGIDVDCVPCLDVPVDGAHDIIGRRAYAVDPAIVAILGRASANGLLAGGVLPVMKHVPGHGRAGVDSHLALPIVDTPLETLEASDFLPFKALSDLPLAMSAHVVYSALAPDLPATLSPSVIQNIIRGAIGFNGALMTDDLSMKALSGTITEKATRALGAGVDLILHCNGELSEMEELAEAVPELQGESLKRCETALELRRPPEAFDEAASRVELAALLA